MSNSATSWTVARQAPLSMGFSRQEYWSGLPCPSPEGCLSPGIKPASLMSPVLAGGFFTVSTTWEAEGPRSRRPIKRLSLPFPSRQKLGGFLGLSHLGKHQQLPRVGQETSKLQISQAKAWVHSGDLGLRPAFFTCTPIAMQSSPPEW